MANHIDLSTEDNLQYTFYPVSSGSISFKIRAPHDAHIALTTGPGETEPMYEVFIGGWVNTKSVIRKNRQKPEKIEVETPGILNAGEFRGFWIRWDCGIIAVGREDDAVPIMSWEDPEPFPVAYFGVCTGWGASGTWKIEGRPEFDTEDKLAYRFHPVLSGSLILEFRGPHNCHIALTKGPRDIDILYEAIIGGWENTKSIIRHKQQKPDKVEVQTPGIVQPNEYRSFLIQWACGRIIVRIGTGNGPILMEWEDPNPTFISHFGVRTGWGARGNWKIPALPGASPSRGASAPSAPYVSGGGQGVWVDAARGEVPTGAVIGGQDGEPMYVARAQHEGALLPGKLIPSHGVAYVPWGGGEHGKEQYQVFCGNANWVPTNGAALPPNALPSGETEDGEPLFVGRVNHQGTLTVGKVQPSHGVCYIAFGGQELGFQDYDVLVQ